MIDKLIDVLVAIWWWLWPVGIVRQTEAAVRFRVGRLVGRVPTGFYWRWWWEDVEKVPSTIQPINLSECTITTQDKRTTTVTMSANVFIRVVDPMKLWAQVDDHEESITNKLLGLLADEGAKRQWNDLKHNRARVQTVTRNRLSKECEAWGVEVVGLHLTDFVKITPYKVYGVGDSL